MNLAQYFRFLWRVTGAIAKERKEAPPRKKLWRSTPIDAFTYHVVPLNDIDDHILIGTTCKCGAFRDVEVPTCIIHYAFDGRDLIERVELGLPLL